MLKALEADVLDFAPAALRAHAVRAQVLDAMPTGGAPAARRAASGRAAPRAPRVPSLPAGDARAVSWYAPCKMAMDLVATALLLVAAAPLIVLCMALVKLTSPGPALYSQTRVGRHGRSFRLYKIRTMIHDCERTSGPTWSTARDPRVTALGRFLRRTHLDELPQLWNILKGEMSLVGPRPERPVFVAQLARALPRYHERLAIKPGLTGLAQVQLPPDTDLESVRRKLRYDLDYIERQGLWLDLRILLGTAYKVVGLSAARIGRLCVLPGPSAVETARHPLPHDRERLLGAQGA